MVAKILQLLYREVRGLHEAAYLLGALAVASQVLALVRDRLFAHNFGAGEVLDIYYAAFRIPDFVFVAVASVVSVYVLIPYITARLEEPEKLRTFINTIFSFFALSIISVSIVAFAMAPKLIDWLFPNLASNHDTLLLFTRILLLQPILLGISSLFASITQVHQKFILYGVSPVLYNVGIIIGVALLYPMFGVIGLVYGVVLGAFLHMAIQVPFIIRQGYIPRFSSQFDSNLIREVVIRSLPRTLTLSMGQIVLVVMISLASFLAAGSIAIFTFSFNLQLVPLSIIGASYSVAAFPTFTRLLSNGNQKEFVQYVSTALRHIVFWTVPAIVLFVVLRAQIVRVILGSGQFDWADTRLTAAALALFIFSLTAHAAMLLLVRGYYASGKTWKPFMINVFSALVTIGSAFIFIGIFRTHDMTRFIFESLLRVDGLAGTEVLMLPLGYTVGMLVNGLLLIVLFQRDFGLITGAIRKTFFQSLIASLGAGMAAYGLLTVLDDIFDLDTFLGIFMQGLIAGVGGVAILVVILTLLSSVELREAMTAFRHKFWKTRVFTEEK